MGIHKPRVKFFGLFELDKIFVKISVALFNEDQGYYDKLFLDNHPSPSLVHVIYECPQNQNK